MNWQGVRRRRREADRRIAAMLAYAGGKNCRRRTLLQWFGERADACGNCDRCGPAKPVRG